MWCDDFDMDLPKVIPEAMAVIASVSNVRLWTRGHSTDGRLNHPAVWNGYTGMDAFFTRHEHVDPVRLPYVTGDPVIECTFAEAVRDCWSHDYALRVDGVVVWDTSHYFNPIFQPLMDDLRGWRPLTDRKRANLKRRVVRDLKAAVARLKAQIDSPSPSERSGVTHE